ncbi:DMT family transporter [uncultured Cocleimonas sp.]|uniref:DMT family transporter n=1 Tax=uncultured Cocleimonas sp. TaxID=1051587 RepID=UPI00260765F7|nr:DMT family transporter [uncultured Cocleimonas sp.]
MDNLRGSLFMVLAMACFTFEDMFIKLASKSVPVGEILIFFGIGGTLAFIVLTLRRNEVIIHPAIKSKPIFLRAMFEVAGRVFYTLAIVFTPLSSASAILQATPLVVVTGAAIFFGEKVGWHRWTAIIVGFIGVLMILQPGLEGFEAASIFAVLGTLGFAGRDLATRAAPKVLSNTQLGIYGFFVLLPIGTVMLLISGGAVIPDLFPALQILGAIIFGVIAYYSLTIAMRIGEVSVVTPFRYIRLVFALILGMLVFSEQPNFMTLLGSAVVVSSGLYTLLRSRQGTSKKLS